MEPISRNFHSWVSRWMDQLHQYPSPPAMKILNWITQLITWHGRAMKRSRWTSAVRSFFMLATESRRPNLSGTTTKMPTWKEKYSCLKTAIPITTPKFLKVTHVSITGDGAINLRKQLRWELWELSLFTPRQQPVIRGALYPTAGAASAFHSKAGATPTCRCLSSTAGLHRRAANSFFLMRDL